jgi:hypothetical protein
VGWHVPPGDPSHGAAASSTLPSRHGFASHPRSTPALELERKPEWLVALDVPPQSTPKARLLSALDRLPELAPASALLTDIDAEPQSTP